MTDISAAQLRLRSAFRYGYFAFMATVLPLAILVGILALALRYAILFNDSPVYSALAVAAAAGLALLMPAFLALWLVVGNAILRQPQDRTRC